MAYRSHVCSSLSLIRNQSNNEDAVLYFAKTRHATVGGSTIVQDDDKLGVISFAGADGTDIGSEAARIQAFVDGTPGANDMPGRLVFSTTADGAASPTTRLTIDSTGKATFTVDASINSVNIGKGANSIGGNTVLGETALDAANSGNGNNTAIGKDTLTANTSGAFCVAVGSTALAANTTGVDNVAVGSYALDANTTGGLT